MRDWTADGRRALIDSENGLYIVEFTEESARAWPVRKPGAHSGRLCAGGDAVVYSVDGNGTYVADAHEGVNVIEELSPQGQHWLSGNRAWIAGETRSGTQTEVWIASCSLAPSRTSLGHDAAGKWSADSRKPIERFSRLCAIGSAIATHYVIEAPIWDASSFSLQIASRCSRPAYELAKEIFVWPPLGQRSLHFRYSYL